ncbi:hypothetical protein EDB87DRAFT_6439 [Lactarius vividus]|nr:hypothetical protein EDB87DRAFT_6439 [Lactarius vividus]
MRMAWMSMQKLLALALYCPHRPGMRMAMVLTRTAVNLVTRNFKEALNGTFRMTLLDLIAAGRGVNHASGAVAGAPRILCRRLFTVTFTTILTVAASSASRLQLAMDAQKAPI